MPDPRHPLPSFGRIKSRTLKPRAAGLIETLLPRLSTPDGAFDPRSLAPTAREVWLEIGFGSGEHMLGQAARRPDVLVIGAEPFLNGVGAALRGVEDLGLGNVRLHAGDGRDVMARLPDASLARIFVLFPDPWPKARHHKRRLISDGFVAEAARLLAPGGRIRFATDWSDYAHWTLERFNRSPAFRWSAERADDWRRPPPDHLTTRYELKRLGDCDPIWLEFERRLDS
ncbi:MAG: tRNA (guanosine(46)-N7)-methyltransferase TrmB [Caulobacterales bacterium]